MPTAVVIDLVLANTLYVKVVDQRKLEKWKQQRSDEVGRCVKFINLKSKRFPKGRVRDVLQKLFESFFGRCLVAYIGVFTQFDNDSFFQRVHFFRMNGLSICAAPYRRERELIRTLGAFENLTLFALT